MSKIRITKDGLHERIEEIRVDTPREPCLKDGGLEGRGESPKLSFPSKPSHQFYGDEHGQIIYLDQPIYPNPEWSLQFGGFWQNYEQ